MKEAVERKVKAQGMLMVTTTGLEGEADAEVVLPCEGATWQMGQQVQPGCGSCWSGGTAAAKRCEARSSRGSGD